MIPQHTGGPGRETVGISPVTDHAVVRWLERVHGMTHLGVRYRSDPERAAAGAAILGLTVDEVRDLVCPPRLHRALAWGLSGIVKGDDRTLRVVEGRVVTVMPAADRRSLRRQPREVRVAASL